MMRFNSIIIRDYALKSKSYLGYGLWVVGCELWVIVV